MDIQKSIPIDSPDEIAGAVIASLFGESSNQQLYEGSRRLKQKIEGDNTSLLQQFRITQIEALSKNQMSLSSGVTASCSQPKMSITVSRAMLSRHICPCCSNVLLRHVRSRQIYWRCGHCYQDMPV